jgi:DNA polymerase III alpha subunit (gram-positive type)
MRLFLLIVVIITLASCGKRRNRGKKDRNREKDQHKDPKTDNDGEKARDEHKEDEKAKEKENQKIEEDEGDDAESHLTCLHGTTVSGGVFKEDLSKLNSCRTGMNSNCVMMYFTDKSDSRAVKVFGCSPQLSCAKFKIFESKLQAGSYCKECNPKFDKCNRDL